uniref:Serine/threonine-protein kinase ATR-like N-HEAT region domain-containing protein n=1 Tax=Anas platyrhynchos platyrhynchos TaxID=8840 RepID=A0A493U4M1_ANAPP
MLLEKLCALFEGDVFRCLHSEKLKAAFCHILQYFLEFVPPGYESGSLTSNFPSSYELLFLSNSMRCHTL